MLATRGDEFEDKICLVSGSGNVAHLPQWRSCSTSALGPVTLSDSDGFTAITLTGSTTEKLEWVKELKNQRRGRIREYVEEFPLGRHITPSIEGEENPLWTSPRKCAFPGALPRTRSVPRTPTT